MRRCCPASLILPFALLLAVAASVVPAADPESEVKWQPDLFTAHRVANAENKPMLLVFGADWCGFCKKMERDTLGHPQMAEYINEEFVPVHLDLDKEKRVAGILEIDTLPCTVVLSPSADLLGKFTGYQSPRNMYRKLAAAKQVGASVQQTGTGR